MTLMLELSAETEARLQRKAERAGQSLPDYLLAVTDAEANEEASAAAGIAADLFAGRIGRFRSGGNSDWPQDTGRKFAEGMAEK